MSVMNVRWNPTERELRVFAVLQCVFLTTVAYTVVWKAPQGLAIVSAVLAVLGLVVPRAIRPFYVIWMAAVFPIGWLVSHVVLAAIYYGMFTPIGLAMKLMGRDAMTRRIDRSKKTYWVRRAAPSRSERYFRQY